MHTETSPDTRKRRRGGRIYHGCSTCRARKIKCDKRQPKCSNCERSRRYMCDGYDETSEVSAAPARGAKASSSSAYASREPVVPSISDAESSMTHATETDSNHSIFHDLDANSTGPTSPPGSGISSQHPHSILEWPSRFFTIPNTDALDPGSSNHLDLQNEFNIQEEFDLGDFLPWIAQQAPFTSPFEVKTPRPHETRLDEALQSASPLEEGADVVSPQASRRHLHSPPLLRGPTPDAIEVPEATRKLLHHYRTHVCQLMMPTSAPSHNPWLRIYLPIALQKPQTAPKTCLLHAICSVAAFNQSELSRGDTDHYRREAREHQEKAWHLLNSYTGSHLPNGAEILTDQPTDRQALLTAALTMTTAEVFSGAQTGKGYEYLLLCKRIIKVTGGLNWWLSDPANVTVLQIFRCLEIVGYTSGWTDRKDNQVGDREGVVVDTVSKQQAIQQPETEETLTMASDLALDYTLDVSFGVSMKTLRCLNKIIELTSTKDTFTSRDDWLSSNLEDLISLEADIFDILDQPDAFSSRPNTISDVQKDMSTYVSEEIKENHVWAFHYSAAIFFRRAVCDGHGSIQSSTLDIPAEVVQKWVSRPSGQTLVSKALDHLENIDALSSDIAIANTLWPGFIATVEAVDMPLRHRSLIWFARAKCRGIGNISKAKDLMMEVWRRADRRVHPERRNLQFELSQVDWREVMREKEMYIMLT